MQGDDILKSQIDSSNVISYRESKADIVQYYQQVYTGKGKGGRGLAWKQQLVADLLADRGITPDNTDKKEYARQKKNLDKRFEKRLESPEPKNKGEYQNRGLTLPPIYNLPFKVDVSGSIRISRNCVPCHFVVSIGEPGAYSLQGGNAEEFVRNPNMWDLIVAYFEGDDDNPAEGWCTGPVISIVA